MKNHFEIFTIYRDFAKMIQTQYSKAIKLFRSDNAREYRQTDFFTILKHYRTIFHTSCVGTSQQNGRAEHKLRHILVLLGFSPMQPPLLSHSGVKLLSLQCTPSTDALHLSFKTQHHMISCLTQLQTTVYSRFLVVSVLFSLTT